MQIDDVIKSHTTNCSGLIHGHSYRRSSCLQPIANQQTYYALSTANNLQSSRKNCNLFYLFLSIDKSIFKYINLPLNPSFKISIPLSTDRSIKHSFPLSLHLSTTDTVISLVLGRWTNLSINDSNKFYRIKMEQFFFLIESFLLPKQTLNIYT